MKKVLAVSLAIYMVVTLAACGSSDSGVDVEDGAFTCTPQELIDSINSAVKNADDDEIYTVGDYPGSGKELQISSTSLTLTLYQNGDGKLQSTQLYWYSGYNDVNVVTSAGCYLQVILNQLTPADAKDIGDSIENVFTSGGGKIERTSGKVKVNYETFGNGGNKMGVSIIGD